MFRIKTVCMSEKYIIHAVAAEFESLVQEVQRNVEIGNIFS
jgi:hypothetical protein